MKLTNYLITAIGIWGLLACVAMTLFMMVTLSNFGRGLKETSKFAFINMINETPHPNTLTLHSNPNSFFHTISLLLSSRTSIAASETV